MDPTQTLTDLRIAIQWGQIEDIRMWFDMLDVWLSRGGFPPAGWDRAGAKCPACDHVLTATGEPGTEGGDRWHCAGCQSTWHLTLSKVAP